MEIEQQLATYIDDHTAAGMCRYREEVWDHAEDLARRASLKWSATWGWWRRFKGRWPSVVTRWKEAVKLERLYAENPEAVERWFNRYKQFLSDKGIEDPEQIVIIDEAGTFIGYGKRRRVVASKGKAASRGEREEREWISVLAGGTAGGTQLPPTYLLRGGTLLGDLREHGYVIRCSKAFNTQDGFREYVTQVLVPCLNASAARTVVVLTDGHRSRIDLQALEYARNHHVHFFLLPPHSAHFLCPLDTHCFAFMKRRFTTHFDGHTTAYKADMSRFVEEFGVAYNAGVTPRNLSNGFHDLGLWPRCWSNVDWRLDAFRMRAKLKAHAEEEQEASIREELEAAAAERPERSVKVVVEWAVPPPMPPSPSSPLSPVSPLSAPSARSSSAHTVSTGCGSPPGMMTSSTQVSPGLKVRKQVWKPKTDGTGPQKPRRLDIVLADGGALNSDECIEDMRRDQDEKERKQQEKQARAQQREARREEKKREDEEKRKLQEDRKRAAEEKKEEKRRRAEEREEAKRQREAQRALRPRRGAKRKASGPERWDDGTTCPCGNAVGTGETENWALCDTCQQWIHDGCYGLVWSRDGAYVEQEDSHWQCTMCRPSSDAAAASDGEYSQTHVSGSDSA